MKVVSELNLKNGEKWFSFFCPGCQCSHHFTDKWQFDGDVEKPTVSPSILVRFTHFVPPVTADNLAQWKSEPWEQHEETDVCHMFIRGGMIEYLNDCTHSLAGQTVPMEPE